MFREILLEPDKFPRRRSFHNNGAIQDYDARWYIISAYQLDPSLGCGCPIIFQRAWLHFLPSLNATTSKIFYIQLRFFPTLPSGFIAVFLRVLFLVASSLLLVLFWILDLAWMFGNFSFLVLLGLILRGIFFASTLPSCFRVSIIAHLRRSMGYASFHP